MDNELGESQNPPGSGSSDYGNHDMSNFIKCKICFCSAQDPIVTLCGHLFCWSCLNKWLRYLRNHSLSHECPVFGVDFPNLPPETTPPVSNMNQILPLGFPSMGVDTPIANVSARNLFTFSATVTPSSGNYQGDTTTTPSFLSSLGHECFPPHPMGAQRPQ
ncbi:hypothetical protein MKW98_005998 [Papaver atlanticum]|uniref:E3 ubiquitin-protein ligase RMA n=1 Tax=Papaver atlanticum TaxID=357466 RepID=A0AAD4S768_9MAGN|nr:hypothetical protein MKW98_005998 [Papaver atlanticum]